MGDIGTQLPAIRIKKPQLAPLFPTVTPQPELVPVPVQEPELVPVRRR